MEIDLRTNLEKYLDYLTTAMSEAKSVWNKPKQGESHQVGYGEYHAYSDARSKLLEAFPGLEKRLVITESNSR